LFWAGGFSQLDDIEIADSVGSLLFDMRSDNQSFRIAKRERDSQLKATLLFAGDKGCIDAYIIGVDCCGCEFVIPV
jgi:hypothetical protein